MEAHAIAVTFAVSAVLGIFLILLADRLRISAIVLLLLGGIAAGPEFLGLVHPEALGEGLGGIITIAVGLILFEGGLTLDVKGYKQVSKEIMGVLTRGVLVTWFVTSLAVWVIFRFDPIFCVLSGSLIIVTGPTVIGPLLQRIRVKKKIHQILYWEGVLIDPIGVFIALLCYEWILTAGSQGAYLNFIGRILVGLVVGLGFGVVVNLILVKEWVKEERINIFVLSTALLNLTLANLVVEESGLLSVTLTGLYLGYKKPPRLAGVIAYKVELKDLLIGLLFILLAANLKIERFLEYGWELLWILLVVLFLIRPLNIFVSTFKSSLGLKDKLFLSWVAPRGIVAASMASLFAFHLGEAGMANSNFLETFTYTVIAGTVIFQGFSARFVAQILGVLECRPTGWLVVGAHKLGRAAARFLKEQGKMVLLIDSNPREVQQAQREGLAALCDNAMQIEPDFHIELSEVGNLLAVTANAELNRLICHRWGGLIKGAGLYYWADGETTKEEDSLTKGRAVWSEFNVKNILARNIDQKELITSVNEVDLAHGSMIPGLFYQQDNQVMPHLPHERRGMALALTLKPQRADLLGPTKTSWVIFSNQRNLDGLYQEMLDSLDESVPLEKGKVLEELLNREKEFSSILGHSIAIPHCYDKALDETIMLVAKLVEPIGVEGTKEVIKLVFMVLSPAGQPEKHLAQISKIAKFIIQEENRNSLILTRNSLELYHVLEQGDVRGT